MNFVQRLCDTFTFFSKYMKDDESLWLASIRLHYSIWWHDWWNVARHHNVKYQWDFVLVHFSQVCVLIIMVPWAEYRKSCGITEKTKYVYRKAKISCAYLGIKLSHIVLQWKLDFIFLPSCEMCLFGNNSLWVGLINDAFW